MNQHLAAAETALRRLARKRVDATRILVASVPTGEGSFAPMATIAWDATPTPAARLQAAQRAYNWMHAVA